MNLKGRQPLLLLLLLGFGKSFVSAAIAGTSVARSSHWLEQYSPSPPLPPPRPATLPALVTDRRSEQGDTGDPDPLKRKIDWGRVREVVFGTDNMVEAITTGVATKIVVTTGYVLAGKFLHHCYSVFR